MENIIKTILFILAGIFISILVILLLPLLLLVYIFLPKRSTKTWFGTFTQQARGRSPRSDGDEDGEQPYASETYSNEIPASEDIIDITAREIEDKDSK